MKFNIRILISISILIIVGLIGYMYVRDVNINTILILFSLEAETYFKIFVGFIISMLIIIIYNNVLLKENGLNLNFGKMVIVFFASQTPNYFSFIKIGIPLRFILLKKLLGIPYPISISNKIVITLLTLLSISIAGIFGSYFSPNIPHIIKIYVFCGGFILTVLLLLTLYFGKNFSKVNNTRIKLINKAFYYTTNIYNIISMISYKAIIMTFLGIFSRSLIDALVSFEIINNISISNISFLDIWTIQAVNSIVSTISLVPMGLGTKDLSLIFLLSVVGLSKEEALLLAIYERVIWMILPFILGLISSFVLGTSVIKKPKKLPLITDY